MGAQGKASLGLNSMQRVKVYQLNADGKWDDLGTGHVTVDYLERSEDLGLIVIDEEYSDTLLMHRISSDEIYKRQEDTIISWRDPEFATELALSFQEATGCSYIWDNICSVQRNMQFSTLGNMDNGSHPAVEVIEASSTSRADDTFHAAGSELRELPSVELSTLPLILKTLAFSGIADQMRVAELILHDQEFLPKLMDLFRTCEDVGNMDGLHMIFKLVKGIILLNSPPIFDIMFGDEFIMDIIGALEYDSEVSQVQKHRTYLKEHVAFKEAIPIKESLVLSKIHQTYRISFIKDVILPRVLDEATISSLNSIIHSNNAVVLSILKDDTSFIKELFSRMRSSKTSTESKRNLVLFFQEFCSLSKSLQLVQQLRLFRDLATEGIFDIITEVLQSRDKKLVSIGTDILLLFVNQDPNLLRTFVIQPEGDMLFRLLVKGMITDFGEHMHCQFLEIVRILLDSYTLSGTQRDAIVEIFYEKHMDQLIDVITSSCPSKSTSQTRVKSGSRIEPHAQTKPEILSNICELLCFCVLHHPYRIKCNFLLNNVIEKVLYLTRRREKYLVVGAVRFMRAIISRSDEHLLCHIVKSNLLKPIVEVFIANGNRYNMLNSGVLELFEYIHKENLKTLVIYVVECFWDQLSKFENLGTIQALKVKYDQSLENCDVKNTITLVDPRRRIDDRALGKEEEEYFNEDSDDEDSASVGTSHAQNQGSQPVLPNGTGVSHLSSRPKLGGLVDDDDDDYKPPPREPGTFVGNDKNNDSLNYKGKSRSTSNSNNEELELTKKRRIDIHKIDGEVVVAAACSTCSHPDSPSRKTQPSVTVPHSADGNSKSDNERKGEKENTVVPRSCSNCLPKTADIRQSSAGEDCPLTPISNSSEMAVNGANVTGSEPYSVR